MKSTKSVVALAVFLACLIAVLTISSPSHASQTTDLPNFHVVAPGIYRGAAPTVGGLTKLRAIGVKTVIDLRIAPKTVAKEKIEAQQLGFNFINLPMSGDPPTPKEVSALLANLNKAPSIPVFVHCQHGADRTGCMIGIYRVTQQGWPYSKAFAEMRKYGFSPRWTKLSDAVRSRATAQ